MSDLSYHRPTEKSEMDNYQALQIIHLRLEVDRLNNEIKRLKRFKKFVPVVGNTDLNDPNFHKPISVIEY